MIDEFREDEIARKVGGRFKLTALIQKRMVSLNKGARPLVDLPTKNLMEIAVAEIMQDKIYLDTSGNVQAAADDSASVDKIDTLDKLLADGGPGIDDLNP
jgi:DNA-directed RNA polymerase subunit omega